MSVLSLLCGIIALITYGVFFLPEVLGIILAFLGKKNGKMRGLAIVGLIVNLIAAAMAAVILVNV